MTNLTAGAAGSVAVLNVGAGDTKLSFDPLNPAERIRAARIVRDMLRRGYALLIEVERDGKKEFQRALDFREDVCEYVIADFDPMTAATADRDEEQALGQSAEAQPSKAPAAGAPAAPSKRAGGKRSVKAESTRAVAVAPIAGG